MITKHTPGPWKYDPDDRQDLQIRDKNLRLLSEVVDNRAIPL
jgi:hypothetical protein